MAETVEFWPNLDGLAQCAHIFDASVWHLPITRLELYVGSGLKC